MAPLKLIVPAPESEEPAATANVPPWKSRSAPAPAVSVAAPEVVPPPHRPSVPDVAWMGPVSVSVTPIALVPVPPVFDSVPALTNAPPAGLPPLLKICASLTNVKLAPASLFSVPPLSMYNPWES